MNRRAFTLVEMMIALTVAAVLMAAVSSVVWMSQRNQGNLETQAELDNQANETLAWVADELRDSGPSCPDWSFSATDIVYNKCLGSSAGAPTWGPACRLALVSPAEDPEDGLDNNGDGVTDEKTLSLDSGNVGIWTTKSAFLRSDGLTFTQTGNKVLIQLVLQRLNYDRSPVVVSASTTVTLRN